MLTIIGIILLLVCLFDYAVHLTAGSLVHLLLLFAAISFGLDFLRSRSSNGRERRPNWDHRPPKEHRRRLTLAVRWLRDRVRSLRSSSQRSTHSEQHVVARGHV
jgi:hypothetical protein